MDAKKISERGKKNSRFMGIQKNIVVSPGCEKRKDR